MTTEAPDFRFDADPSGRSLLESRNDFPRVAADARQRV